MIKRTSAVLVVAAVAVMAVPVWGRTSYPNRAIRMVAPFAPGGASDFIARMLAPTFISMLVVRAHINAGRLRLLGVGTPQRAKALPDVPAIAETLPGFETTSWYTVMGPARLPATVIARLNREVNALANSPEVADRLANDTVEPKALSPEATAKHVADEITRWKAVAQRAGVRLE